MEDLNLHAGDAILDNEEKLIWQQVELLFDTRPGQLFGDSNFGTDYEHFLYDLKLSANDLKQQMEEDLNNMELFGYTYNANAYLLKGTQRDIALIKVDLYDGENNVNTKIYKID